MKMKGKDSAIFWSISLVLSALVITNNAQEVWISNAYHCFKEAPSFVDIGKIPEWKCRTTCIMQKCLFYNYTDETCYIDSSASDTQTENYVIRNFIKYDMTFLGYQKPTYSSLPFMGYYSHRAVDRNLGNRFHSQADQSRHWWILDLMRSFEISQISITQRGSKERFRNIKIYISQKLNSENFFENDDMVLFIHQVSLISEDEFTLSPHQGTSVCGRYIVFTKVPPPELDHSLMTMELSEVRPIVLNW